MLADVGLDFRILGLGPSVLYCEADVMLLSDRADRYRVGINGRVAAVFGYKRKLAVAGREVGRDHAHSYHEVEGYQLTVAGLELGFETRDSAAISDRRLQRLYLVDFGVGWANEGASYRITGAKVIGPGGGLLFSRRSIPLSGSWGLTIDLGLLFNLQRESDSDRRIARGELWLTLGASWGVKLWKHTPTK